MKNGSSDFSSMNSRGTHEGKVMMADFRYEDDLDYKGSRHHDTKFDAQAAVSGEIKRNSMNLGPESSSKNSTKHKPINGLTDKPCRSFENLTEAPVDRILLNPIHSYSNSLSQVDQELRVPNKTQLMYQSNIDCCEKAFNRRSSDVCTTEMRPQENFNCHLTMCEMKNQRLMDDFRKNCSMYNVAIPNSTNLMPPEVIIKRKLSDSSVPSMNANYLQGSNNFDARNITSDKSPINTVVAPHNADYANVSLINRDLRYRDGLTCNPLDGGKVSSNKDTLSNHAIGCVDKTNVNPSNDLKKKNPVEKSKLQLSRDQEEYQKLKYQMQGLDFRTLNEQDLVRKRFELEQNRCMDSSAVRKSIQPITESRNPVRGAVPDVTKHGNPNPMVQDNKPKPHRTSLSSTSELPTQLEEETLKTGRGPGAGGSLMDKYESLGLVGEGSYGMVLKCRHRESGQLVAIKKFIDSENDRMVKKIAMREIRMLKQLRHDNLVNLIEVFRRKKRLYLVFEFVDHTVLDDLERHNGGLGEESVRQVIWQVLKGIEFCHLHNTIHRDIKPENILVSKTGVVKMCDFGFARTLAKPGEIYTEYVATRWYRAPELLVGDTNYGRAVDIWAIGCLLAELLTGDPLFPGDSDIDQLFHIVKCFGNLTPRHQEIFQRNPLFERLRLPVVREVVPLSKRFTKCSPAFLDFMERCLRLDADERPTCSELLRHPLFTADNFNHRFAEDLKKRTERDRLSNPLLARLQPLAPRRTHPQEICPKDGIRNIKDSERTEEKAEGEIRTGNQCSDDTTPVRVGEGQGQKHCADNKQVTKLDSPRRRLPDPHRFSKMSTSGELNRSAESIIARVKQQPGGGTAPAVAIVLQHKQNQLNSVAPNVKASTTTTKVVKHSGPNPVMERRETSGPNPVMERRDTSGPNPVMERRDTSTNSYLPVTVNQAVNFSSCRLPADLHVKTGQGLGYPSGLSHHKEAATRKPEVEQVKCPQVTQSKKVLMNNHVIHKKPDGSPQRRSEGKTSLGVLGERAVRAAGVSLEKNLQSQCKQVADKSHYQRNEKQEVNGQVHLPDVKRQGPGPVSKASTERYVNTSMPGLVNSESNNTRKSETNSNKSRGPDPSLPSV